MATKSKDGLTAWEAIRLLSSEPGRDPLEFSPDHQLFAGGVTYVDREYDTRFRPEARLLDRLVDRAWYAMGLRLTFEPNDQPEHIPAHLWDVLDLDPDANTASGGGLEYVRLRFYEGDGIIEPPELAEAERRQIDRRPRTRDVEADALLKNRIKTVIAKAKNRWPDPEKRPGLNQMARLLVEGQPKSKVEKFGEDAIRKILAGTYKPARNIGIPGLSSG